MDPDTQHCRKGLPADLSPPGVAAVHDVVRHQEEGLQELHCPAQDVGQPVQYTIMITFWVNKRGLIYDYDYTF